ncbi:hypothetical protein F5050DRAFT_524268 [Lentinula boryana]|uniref:Secreted protein n=1 Tax=Lentinula boryana TaxID=40481 RepID=A0ABQ8Q7B5_9AGAR|nr:hypothetical protein F5050DRAFT_524268 [Lentinula boryana]
MFPNMARPLFTISVQTLVQLLGLKRLVLLVMLVRSQSLLFQSSAPVVAFREDTEGLSHGHKTPVVGWHFVPNATAVSRQLAPQASAIR